jgi:predicted Zn-dependent protease
MHTESEPSLVRLELHGRGLLAIRAGAVLWATGWFATEASALSQGFQYGWTLGGIVCVALWTLVGAVALIAVGWAAAGTPEVVTVTTRTLELRRGVGPFARTQCFDGNAIRALRILEPASPLRGEYAAIRAFWDRGAGRIGFDVDGRTYAFGPLLDDATIDQVLSTIATRLPAALVQPEDGELDRPRSRRRRPGWAAHVTGWVLVGALLIPTRTFITDLPICTGGALGGPYDPIDPGQLRADGRVVLVPFGEFPADAAQQLAEHFRAKYGLDIQAARRSMPLPEDTWNAERGQADSEVLLEALARSYPETPTRTVVIGLTSADIFIPGVSWSYAFSNRHAPRLAVVSPARMDRGCMGIRPADDATQIARLRKMVGKNIGLLFYGLPPSRHPRSMLYAWIGGPQELDTMGEDF